jgi:hypothetical protein
LKRILFSTLGILVITTLILIIAQSNHATPKGILLTWETDPTTTITAQWLGEHPAPNPLGWRTKSSYTPWKKTPSKTTPFPNSEKFVHKVHLQNLKPNTLYDIKIGNAKHTFKTAPKTLERPLVFLAGGDMMQSLESMVKTNLQTPTHNALFAAIGGDLTYDDGSEEHAWKWDTWINETTKSLKTSDGRLLPIITCPGNHETTKGLLKENQGNEAPYYQALFPKYPQSLVFGDYLTLLLLDTQHLEPIAGNQTQWIKKELENTKTPFTICIYHIPAYPSVRDFNQKTSQDIRTHWVPLFESHPVSLCLENHDHAYKRTHPLLQNQPNPTGITYIGDGCWGVIPRKPTPRDYIKTASPTPHFLKVTLTKTHLTVEAINQSGEIFDYHQTQTKK